MKHIMIHCRSNNFFTGTRHNSGCQHIICNTVGNFADNVRARRRYHYNVGFFRKRNVLNTIFKISVKSIYQTFMLCQCFKSNRIDKISGILRHKNIHVAAAFYKHTRQICNFICRNTACDSK